MRLSLPSLLFPVLLWLVIVVVLLGGGIGIGYLLHWLLPSVDLGVGILIGVIVIPAAVRAWASLTSAVDSLPPEDEDLVEGGFQPTVIYPLRSSSKKRRRRTRRVEKIERPPSAT